MLLDGKVSTLVKERSVVVVVVVVVGRNRLGSWKW